jgi:hypothetical protein
MPPENQINLAILEPDLEALTEAEGLAMRAGSRPKINSDVVGVLRQAIHGYNKAKLQIERVELLDKTFARKREFSLQAYAQRSFGVFQEKPVDAAWKFIPKASPDARDFSFHPTQTIEPQPDDSLIVRFRAGDLLETAWHLFTLGGSVRSSQANATRAILRTQLTALERLPAHAQKGTMK